jgi:DNA-binding GntR family transcriptional regulator
VTTDPAQVRPLHQSSLVSQVTVEIRRSILAGRLRPGQEFSLRAIASQLGVSLIPVREALRSLEEQGLVVTRPGRSAMVAPLDAADLAGIYALRRQIEPELAARSCQLLRSPHVRELRRLVGLISDEGRGLDGVYESHHELHLEMLRPAATAWDLHILSMLWRAAERYIRVAFGGLDDHPHEHARRGHVHAELVDAFESGDVDAVRAAVRSHLDANERVARGALANIGSE